MIAAVAATHAAVWYLFHNPKLSAGARQAIEAAFNAGDQIGVSSISLVEMVYLGEKGRIPASAVQDLIRGLLDPEYPLHELPVDASVAQHMAFIGRDEVPDMPTELSRPRDSATEYQ
jgi:PIN domain nuclease of toxin-antitoxin system